MSIGTKIALKCLEWNFRIVDKTIDYSLHYGEAEGFDKFWTRLKMQGLTLQMKIHGLIIDLLCMDKGA